MKSIIESNDDNGWIFIHEILGWPMMRYNSATEQDIIILAQYSENFEVNNLKIRQIPKIVNAKLRMLGFDQEGIRNLKKD